MDVLFVFIQSCFHIADPLPFSHGYKKSSIILVSAIGSMQSLVIIFHWGKEAHPKSQFSILNIKTKKLIKERVNPNLLGFCGL